MSIKFNQVQFRYPKMNQPLLDIQSLRIASGEKIFLHGASGSGKTTLLSLIAGVLIPNQGSIEILDRNTTEMRPSQRDQLRADHLGFIFQIFNLIPYLSIMENVLLTTRFSNKRKSQALRQNSSLVEEACRLLAALQLPTTETFLKKSITELSVGQQQRVAAARAFIGSPEIIVADEPTSALDNESRDRFVGTLFTECQKNDTTLIYVSHDDSMANRFDRKLDIKSFHAKDI